MKKTDKEKKDKKQKKLLPAKKLPKIFRKKYTEKALKKKIFNKIYIESDSAFLDRIFISQKNKKGKEYWTADLSLKFPKSDIKRYKRLAKQIKLNRSGFKLVPFIAVLVLLAGIFATVVLFKNVVVKKAITSTMQSIFEAKTDIKKVDVQFINASLTVEGLQQANKDELMKNIFEIEKIQLDFNLADLLKGKFHSENLEVSGVRLNTDRTKSGYIPAKIKKQKKEKNKESKIDMKALGGELQNMFASYNPENLLAAIKNDLKSPELAEKLSADVKEKVQKWSSVPAEYEASIKNLQTKIDAIMKTDWSKVNDIEKIKQATELITSTLNEADALMKKIDSSSSQIKSDSKQVQDYSNQIQQAIKNDTTLVDKKIKEMKNLFSVSGMQSIMTQAVSGLLDSVLGKYSPYVQKGMDFVQSIKQTRTPKEKKVKTEHKRMDGRTIYYREDRVPKLYIENIKASGYDTKTNDLLFSAVAQNITSNQELINKASNISADFNVADTKNSAKVKIDTRKTSTDPLVLADYNGKNFPINANVDVFDVKSKSNIDAKVSAKENGDFVIAGSLEMLVSQMEGMTFEPASINKIYKNALANVKKLNVSFEATYSQEKGTEIKLLNPDVIGKQLATPVVDAIGKELNTYADDAKKQVEKLLSEKTGIATEKIQEFTNIENLLNNSKKELTKLQDELKKQQNALKAKVEDTAKKAVQDATKKATDTATDSAKKLLKGLF